MGYELNDYEDFAEEFGLVKKGVREDHKSKVSRNATRRSILTGYHVVIQYTDAICAFPVPFLMYA